MRRLTQLTASGTIVALLAMMLAMPGPAGAHAGTACSTSGLSFSYRNGTAAFGDKVEGLIVSRVRCTTGRTIATRVAQALLHNRVVPREISGLRVRVSSPCTGCAPVYGITARAGARRVTFQVFDGA
jgi:hypothetical protein